MKSCAVVILNYNGKSFLEKFLPSVIQYSEAEADVIVIDNASTDNSVSFLKVNFSNVQLVKLKTNYGFAGGYNKGLANLNYEYFLLLNSDVEVTKGWLSPLIETLNKNSNIGSVQPKVLAYKNKLHFEHAGAAGGYVDRFGYPYCRGRVLNITEKDSGQYNNEVNVFWTSGACMLIRSSAFKDLQGFDEDFFAHMEEIDLCWRLQKLGYVCKFEPASKVYHVGGGTLDMESPFKVYLNFRNSLFMLTKNLSVVTLMWLLPFRMVLDGIAGIKFLTEAKFAPFWAIIKAHFSFYASFLKTIGKRKQIKETKYVPLNKRSIIYDFYLKGKKTY